MYMHVLLMGSSRRPKQKFTGPLKEEKEEYPK
jgi:hypothetical protein